MLEVVRLTNQLSIPEHIIKAPSALMPTYISAWTGCSKRVAIACGALMLKFLRKEEVMSRIPQPSHPADGNGSKWRKEPPAADYSDDINEANFKALKKISEDEASREEFDLIDGPAW
ncbi:hypothetical protein [Mesorhizobium sp. LNJC394B00]|uniref:hypothetical protein n=1 Tax=Mesorhizobium sp. LNJC394B00 TaxID=1287274 RepID=UPI0003CDE227|nr:hypothetical protein [Mesorhizobium sp. LNJC394B00]ESY15199.1 hypothetical protein X750_29355 [Mesorhizobium sp. LNJC394B00]